MKVNDISKKDPSTATQCSKTLDQIQNTDEKYSNKYSYLLEQYKNIIQIQIEFYISKI